MRRILRKILVTRQKITPESTLLRCSKLLTRCQVTPRKTTRILGRHRYTTTLAVTVDRITQTADTVIRVHYNKLDDSA